LYFIHFIVIMPSNCVKKFLTRKKRKRPKATGQGSHSRQEGDHGVDADGVQQCQVIIKCEDETTQNQDLEKVSLDCAHAIQEDEPKHACNRVAGTKTTSQTHIKQETFQLEPDTKDHSYQDLILSPLDGTESLGSGSSPSYHPPRQQQQLELLLETKDGTIQHLSEDLRQTRMELFQTRKELQASRLQSHKLKERAFAIHQKFLRWNKLLKEWMARNNGKPMQEWEPTPGFDIHTTTPSSAMQPQAHVEATVGTVAQHALPLVRAENVSDKVCSTQHNLMSSPRPIQADDNLQSGDFVSDQTKTKLGSAQPLTGRQHISASSTQGMSNPHALPMAIQQQMHQEKAQTLRSTRDRIASSLPAETIMKLQPVTQGVVDIDPRAVIGRAQAALENSSHNESGQVRGKDKNVRISEPVASLMDLSFRPVQSTATFNKENIFSTDESEVDAFLRDAGVLEEQRVASSRQKHSYSFVQKKVDKTSDVSIEGNEENMEPNLLNLRRVSMTPKSNPAVPFSQNSCSTEGSLTQLDPPHPQVTTGPSDTAKSRVLPQKRLFTSVAVVNTESDIKAKHSRDKQNETSGDTFQEWATSEALLERHQSDKGCVQRSPVNAQHATNVCIQPASVPTKSFADTSCHSVARSINGWRSNVMARKFVDDALGPPPAKKPAVEETAIRVEKKVDACGYSVSRSINAWRSNVMAREFIEDALNPPQEKQTIAEKTFLTHEKISNPSKNPVNTEKPFKETGVEVNATTNPKAATQNKSSSSTWLNAKVTPTCITKNSMESQVDYKHVEVVRGKKKRECLPGHSCQCCDPFWSAVCDGNDVFDRKQFQDCSRHRAAHSPENTPPNFWDLSFRDEVLAREERRIKSCAPTADETTEM
jgi:hypothetical protein